MTQKEYDEMIEWYFDFTKYEYFKNGNTTAFSQNNITLTKMLANANPKGGNEGTQEYKQFKEVYKWVDKHKPATEKEFIIVERLKAEILLDPKNIDALCLWTKDFKKENNK